MTATSKSAEYEQGLVIIVKVDNSILGAESTNG